MITLLIPFVRRAEMCSDSDVCGLLLFVFHLYTLMRIDQETIIIFEKKK